MIRRKLTAIAAAITMVATLQTSQAAFTDTLGNLVTSGGSLTIGDKLFSGFSYTATGLSGFDAATISVTASIGAGGVYYLTYGGNMQLAGTVGATADLLLGYTVTVTDPGWKINMIDQRYTGGVLNGSLLINETATSGAPTATSQLSIGDASDPNVYPSGLFDTGELDILGVLPPQTTLTVTKDIAFTILNGNPLINGGISQVSVSSVQQSFHQVPEPTTIIAGALLLLPFGASTIRFIRKNRAA